MTALTTTRAGTSNPQRAITFRLRRPSALGWGLGLLAALAAAAVLIPILSPYEVTTIGDTPFAGISADHWLGTDNLGRDNLTRLAAAARVALIVSFFATAVAAVVGSAICIAAGYLGGMVDNIVMRLVDILLAIPAVLLALLAGAVFGHGMLPLILALALIATPGFARLMRAPIMALKERDFVVAAEVAGVRRPQIAVRHLLPNALTPLFVQFASTASLMVLLESTLSFLGQGIVPPDPSAGRMISDAIRFMQRDPMLILLPAALIVVVTIAWNLIADGLQNKFSPHGGALRIAVGPQRPLVRRSDSAVATPTPPPLTPGKESTR